MKSIIQVIENPDRYHVCLNNIPQQTLLHSDYLSKQICLMCAESYAYKLALREQSDDFEIVLKPLQTK